MRLDDVESFSRKLKVKQGIAGWEAVRFLTGGYT